MKLYVHYSTKKAQYYSSILAKNKALSSITEKLNSIDYKNTSVLLLGQYHARLTVAYQRLQNAMFVSSIDT